MSDFDLEDVFPEGLGRVLDDENTRKTGALVFVARSENGSRAHVARIEKPTAGRLRWLWPGRIPLRGVTLIEGPAGAGKSFVALDLAARLSDGRPWADGAPQEYPGSKALLFCRQDHHSEIVGARLEGLGAQSDRVLHFQSFEMMVSDRKETSSRVLSFPLDLPALEELLARDQEIRLVVIDPLSDFCTKRRLAPLLDVLGAIACRHQVAIVVTLRADGKFDRQGQWQAKSKFHTEGARCQWGCMADPQDPRRKLFLPTLMNYAELPTGLAFTIGDHRLDWLPEAIDPCDPTRSFSECEQWLCEALGDGQEAPVKEINRAGSGFGFSPSMLHRAAKKLKAQRRREGFSKGSRVFWALRAPGDGGRDECGVRNSECGMGKEGAPEEPEDKKSEERGEKSETNDGSSPEALRRGVEEGDRQFEEVAARVREDEGEGEAEDRGEKSEEGGERVEDGDAVYLKSVSSMQNVG